jgi:hypothetical protein
MIAGLLKMDFSLCTCLQGGRLRMGVPMMFVCVALTRGRVIGSSLPTVTAVEQPSTPLTLTEVTPSLRFSRNIYKTIRNPDPTKLKLKSGIKVSGGHNYLKQDREGAIYKGVNNLDVLLRKRA